MWSPETTPRPPWTDREKKDAMQKISLSSEVSSNKRVQETGCRTENRAVADPSCSSEADTARLRVRAKSMGGRLS